MKNRNLKVGVVGVGAMGRNHLRVLSTMREYDLVGCFDIDERSCGEQARLYGITAYTNPQDLYHAVDVVAIAVPTFLHREFAVAAAGAGCHVLVEKPIAFKLADGQAIIDACHQAGVRLCVGHIERFNPAVSTMLQIIAQEEPLYISFHRMSPYYGRASDVSVVEDLMIHDIDVLNAIASSPVKQVLSQGTIKYTDKLDLAQALIAYENGLVASLTASRVTEAKIRRAEISARNCFISVDYLNRTVEISRKTNFSLDVGYPVQYSQENIIEKVFVPIIEPLRSEFEHFAHCINTGDEIATNGEMALKALELCKIIQEGVLKSEG